MSDDLDDFLSAPDTVRKSETETAKYKRRKAKAEAEERQLHSYKSGEVPSDEDLLADLVRVAEDPNTNPMGWRFKTLSRKRYREFGHFPVEFVDNRYGQFTHALEVAGLRDKPGTKARKRATTRDSRDEHAARYQERFMFPFRCNPVERMINGTELLLSISDTHSTYLDPFVWHSFLVACRELQPDIVVFNGDILEGSAISSHPKIPGHTIPLRLEFEFARTMFEQVREILPDADIWWMAGNHGLDRFARYMAHEASALVDLPNMRFDKLVGLDDLDIKLSQGGSIMSPVGTEEDREGELFGGFYGVYHGRKLGMTPYMTELRSSMRSGQTGHIHRAGLAYMTTEFTGAISHMSTPMGCTHHAGKAYMKGNNDNWQKGFGIAFLHEDGRVHQYPVVTSQGVAIFEGIQVTENTKRVADVTKNWLLS